MLGKTVHNLGSEGNGPVSAGTVCIPWLSCLAVLCRYLSVVQVWKEICCEPYIVSHSYKITQNAAHPSYYFGEEESGMMFNRQVVLLVSLQFCIFVDFQLWLTQNWSTASPSACCLVSSLWVLCKGPFLSEEHDNSRASHFC